jgi:hypothetical protein
MVKSDHTDGAVTSNATTSSPSCTQGESDHKMLFAEHI